MHAHRASPLSARPWRSVLALLALSLAACGPRDRAPAVDSTPVPATSTFRVALLTPGPISDQSWNGGAYAGLMAIRDSLGAAVSHIQTRTPAEFEENFRQYGSQGYTLVFGHGFEFQDAAKRVAPDHPGTLYVTTSGSLTGANLAGIRFAFEEPSYVAGIVAALTSRTAKVAAIGGAELPPVKASFAAFAAGARSVTPGIEVSTAYLGNWDDVNAGKEQALAQIARGADVIFQNADAAGLGVFQAARERKGVWVIGANADQNGIAPEVTLGSVFIDLPLAFLMVAREVKSGAFTPRVVSLGTASGVVRFLPNPAASAQLSGRVQAVLDSVSAGLAAGRITVPVTGSDSVAK